MDRLSNLLGALGVAVVDDLQATAAATSQLALTDAACLNVIAHDNGCSVRYLSDTLSLSHPGAVRLVDRLADAGLVERRSGPDLRTVGLHLTPKGKRRWESQRTARGERLDAAVAELTTRQRACLASAVERLLAGFTTSERRADQLCRFCDESTCPQDECPVTCAVDR